jgi:hypothetical protein
MESIVYQSDLDENPAWEKTETKDYAIATVVSIFIVAVCILLSLAVVHWFLVPVILCGILIGADGVAWFRGNMDTFDVKGLIGASGYHFFFTAPLMYIVFNEELAYLNNPADWRPWLGKMALLNLVGLILYKLIEQWSQRGIKPYRKVWLLSHGRAVLVIVFALVAAFASQIFLFVIMGGFGGLATAFTVDSTSLSGMGSFRVMGSGLPILILIALTLFHRRESQKTSWVTIFFILSFLSVLHILSTGMSTDRGLIITAILWMGMIIHYFWRFISPRTMILMILPLVPLMWIYSFYKALGMAVFQGGSIASFSAETGRGLIGTLLGDAARVDIQPYIMYMLENYPEDYDLRHGSTYLEAVYPIIPLWIWPGKPANAGKTIAGTELLYGKAYYQGYNAFRRTNHAFGIAGEAMLNFGMIGAPIAYAIMGFIVGRFRRYMRGIPPGDLRLLFLPYATLFIVNMLLWDSDNYLAHFLMRGSFSVIVCFFIATRVPISEAEMEQSEYLDDSTLEYL